MPYPSRLILALPLSDPSRLPEFVETCLLDGVELIALAGAGARDVEDRIDRLIVGDGSRPDRFIVTTAHEEDGLKEALTFAENWETDDAAPPGLVRL